MSNNRISSTEDYPAPTFHYGNPDSSNSFELSGKIMLSAIIILFCVVVIMAALHFYARWYLLRARRRQILRRRSRLNEARSRASHIVFYADDNPTTVILSDPGNRGLDSSVLRSLPVFVYSPKTQPEALDCAVCLSEFEDNETGRVLPKCNHAFHIECIDMWFHSHSTCPLCRAPVEPVPEPAINCSGLSQVERTGVEPAGSSSAVCVACYHEEGNSSTTSSGSHRKGLDVIIEVPVRNGLESEFTLSSPASGGGFKSPGARLFSEKMKRMLSIGGRKTPTGECSTMPSGAATSCHTAELDLEQGPSELTPSQTPR